MRSETGHDQRPPARRPRQHRWVAAALVGVGQGTHHQRADRAARTGRYVVPADTWLEVLEVYCAQCRSPYDRRLAAENCPGMLSDQVGYDRTTPTGS